MTDKPKIIELARGAKDFLLKNKDYFFAAAKLVAVPILLIELVVQIGGKHMPILTLLGLVSFYFYACFILSTHRAVLVGADKSQAVNPFAPGLNDGKFVLLFFGLTILPIVIGLILAAVFSLLSHVVGGAGGILIGIVAFCLCIYLLVLFMRLFFMLPARSLGAKMSFKEAIAASRGLLLRWIGAGLVFGIVAGLPYLIYIFVMSFVVLTVLGAQASLLTSIGLYILVGVPAVLFGLLSAAYNAVILSRLYQWSMQERPMQP